MLKNKAKNYSCIIMFLCCCFLFVFYIPSTARSFRDGTPIYCPLRRTRSSVNIPFPPGIEPRAVAWQSITLLLHHAGSTHYHVHGSLFYKDVYTRYYMSYAVVCEIHKGIVEPKARECPSGLSHITARRVYYLT